MKKDLNKIVQIEKAIAKKYGKEAVANPKSGWTDEKEKEYLEELKQISHKDYKKSKSIEKVEKDGFLLSKNLINRKSKRKCSVCDVYSFDMEDDLYMNKFECCFQCFVQWVEGREERWKKGWRPNNETS